MFGMDMLTKSLIGYLETNPEFRAQIDAARDGLLEFVQNSRANGEAIRAIMASQLRMEAAIGRIENLVAGGVNLKDDALLLPAGALRPVISPALEEPRHGE